MIMENEFNNCCGQNKNREMSKRNSQYDIFDPFFDGFFRFPSFKREIDDFDKLMKTDVKENENGYELEIEMPGFEKENINLELSNGYLTITAHQTHKENENDKKRNYIRRERYYGNCARSFYVGDIREEDISASLDKGVLHIEIPKETKRETNKRIEIK